MVRMVLMERCARPVAWCAALVVAACGDSGARAVPTSPAGAGDAGGPGDLFDASVLPDGAPIPDGGVTADAGPLPAPFLGGNVETGGVVFRVWAPHATAALVRGDFAHGDVTMTAIPGGVFEAHVPGAHAGSTYRYVFKDRAARSRGSIRTAASSPAARAASSIPTRTRGPHPRSHDPRAQMPSCTSSTSRASRRRARRTGPLPPRATRSPASRSSA